MGLFGTAAKAVVAGGVLSDAEFAIKQTELLR